MKVWSFFGCACLALSAASIAQEALSNASIEKMVRARLGDDVIVSMIQSQAGHYDVTPDSFIALKFRTMTGGVFHRSGGSSRDAVDFVQTRIAKHIYKIRLAANLPRGEYAFLAPGLTNSSASGSTGKAYTFRLVE